MWWVFPNATAARNAEARISANMGIPVSADAVTRRWADLRNTADAKVGIPRPAPSHRTGVGAHEETDTPNWPAISVGQAMA
jgi:hypothetical protein